MANKDVITVEYVTCFEQYQNDLNLKIIDISDNNPNNAVENLLANHIRSNTITEITGEPGSGRTQLCFYLSVITQLSLRESGSFINDNEVFYVSTNRNFTARRINEIIKKILEKTNISNCKIEDFTKKIYTIDVNSIDELFSVVVLLETWLEDRRVKLLIVDSISFIAKQCDCIERTSFVYTILQNLRLLARRFKFGIILTNDFTTKITKHKTDLIPCFGDSFHHLIDTRLLLEKTDRFYINLEKNVLNENQTIAWEF